MAQAMRIFQVASKDIVAANIAFTEYYPSKPPFPGRLQYVLLLHGWMGTARDLIFIATSLAQQGYVVLTPDLPFHGKSIGARPQTITEACDMMFRALASMIPSMERPFPIAIAGYSLGGRVAFEMMTLATRRERCVLEVKALVLISSAPSPRADVEMEREFCVSVELQRAEQLRDLDTTKEAFQRWLLRSWYSNSMWGSISKAPGFQTMINSRVDAFDKTQRDAWCEAAVCMGRATMTEPAEKFELRTLYVCGVHDSRYLLWSQEMLWFLRDYQCVQVHDSGHNVILEHPGIVDSSISEFLHQAYREPGTGEWIDVQSIKIYRYSLPLKKEIMVNGKEVRTRDGVLVAVLSKNGCLGVGDVCPLPGLHKESIRCCIDEISRFSHRVCGDQMCLTFSCIVGSASVLSEYSPATRSGLEAACLHLMSQSKGLQPTDFVSRFVSTQERRLEVPSSTVFVNGVLPRMTSEQLHAEETDNRYQQFVAESAFDTLKLKVGSSADIENDGLMAKEATAAAACLQKKVRLDANRAWSTENFKTFLSFVEDRTSDIEFIEEPLESANELEAYLARELNIKSTISIALDESLEGGPSEQVRRMASSCVCKALVLKPAVIGSLQRVVDLATIALDTNCEIILSTCFDSGVGIAWTAVMASVFGRSSSRHGLGTYSYLEEHALKFSFASSCLSKDCSRVVINRCESFLERAAQYVADNGVTLKGNGEHQTACS